jgi:hypothetical protein
LSVTIGVAFVSDREDRYLPDCQRSFGEHVIGWADYFVVDDRDHRLGLSGAVRAAWGRALAEGWDYLFHVEEDFRFVADVNLLDMAAILAETPRLAQLVLRRPAFSVEERAAGGIIEMHPEDYTDREGWIETRRLFSLNPCLVPRRVLELGWTSDESEFTARALAAGYSFGFYGDRSFAPVVHDGVERGRGWHI